MTHCVHLHLHCVYVANVVIPVNSAPYIQVVIYLQNCI